MSSIFIIFVNVIIVISAILGGAHIASHEKPLKLFFQVLLAGVFIHALDISYNIYFEFCEYNMDGLDGLLQLDACLGAREKLMDYFHIWVAQAFILASTISLPILFILRKSEARDRAG